MVQLHKATNLNRHLIVRYFNCLEVKQCSLTHISVISMLGCEQLHDLPLGSVRSDGIACVKVRVAGAEEVSLFTATAAAAITVEVGPLERRADAFFL